MSLNAGIADPEALLMAVALGDVKTVASALEKHPEMVTVKLYMWSENWISRNDASQHAVAITLSA